MMKSNVFLAAVLCSVAASSATLGETLHTFQKTQLSDQFWCEGANFADLNNDAFQDIIAGPWWWEGPEFKIRHEIYAPTTTFELKLGPKTSVQVPGFEGALGNVNRYSDNFFIFTEDFNRDGWRDILMIGFPGKETCWFENPKGRTVHWPRHVIFSQTDNESPTYTDLTGDGKAELVCITQGRYGYATPDPADPLKPWTFHPISPDNKYGNFTHGMGVGDVNGDGRKDLLEKDGWWEQPASLEGDPLWTFHKQPMGIGGSQMHAYDINGDGLNDIITGLAAHAFGLAWYEQYREGGEIRFREHILMNKEPRENKYGVKFSELHAIDLVDMDGDGLKDIVTGKRFWSHGRTGDPDRNSAAVLYWFKLQRGPGASVDFIPHLIDDSSGVGVQVVARDLNGDELPDIVVGNKKGIFVHIHKKKEVSRDEWEKAQPKPFASASPWDLPATDAGLPGDGPLRRYDWFQKLWKERRSAWATQVQKDQGAVVLVGDSITQGWGDQTARLFPGIKIANRGISGDTTRGVLIRLKEDVLALNPAAVVLLIGTNDLEEQAEPEVIASNFKKIAQTLKQHNPKMPVLVCQVFPSSDSKKRPTAKIQAVNKLYASILKGDSQFIPVETFPLFSNPQGDAKPEEFPDLLHLNTAGYEKWAAALRPFFATLGLLETEPESFTLEPGFESLFNGRDLTGWGFRPTSDKDREAARKWQASDPNAAAWPFVDAPVAFDGQTASHDGRFFAKNGRLVVSTPPEGRRIQQLYTTRDFPSDFILKLEFRAAPNADSGVFIRTPQLQCRDYLIAGPYKKLTRYKPQDWNELVVAVTNNVAYATCNGEVLEKSLTLPNTGPIGVEGDRGQMEYRRLRIRELRKE